MTTLLVILAIIVCVLLGIMILIQNPKGGGLSSGFAGSNNIMGVQRTGDFLEKGTWALIVTLMVCSLLINATIDKRGGGTNPGEDLQKQLNKSAPVTLPSTNLPPLPAADSTKK